MSNNNTNNVVPEKKEELIKKGECKCTHNKDFGRLTYYDKLIEFKGLDLNFRINYSDITSISKKGRRKIVIRTKSENYVFSPQNTKRGTVFSDLAKVLGDNKNIKSDQPYIDEEGIVGKDDEIVVKMFESELPQARDHFVSTDSKDFVKGVDQVFPISLKGMFALVFSDSSDFTNTLHAGRCNDKDVEVEKWEIDPSGTYYNRKLTFNNKNSMASYDVVQTQHIRYGENKLLYETLNEMTGFKYSDYFRVQTQWVFTDDGPESTHVTCYFRVLWVKNPMGMIKSMIEKNTQKETKQWCDHFVDNVWSYFSGKVEKPNSPLSEEKTKFNLAIIIPIILIVILLLTTIFFWSNSSSYKDLSTTLQNDITRLSHENEQYFQNIRLLESQLQDTQSKLSSLEEKQEQLLNSKISNGLNMELFGYILSNYKELTFKMGNDLLKLSNQLDIPSLETASANLNKNRNTDEDDDNNNSTPPSPPPIVNHNTKQYHHDNHPEVIKEEIHVDEQEELIEVVDEQEVNDNNPSNTINNEDASDTPPSSD
eukprot:TRINITY_DN1104_c0_g6_i1.p1 TRINITY_DN1104_c0_g6~~TRINITY_DN1104_c0_g6_i1.p1  ORF type:complete len:538 (-),score=158.26 TRINITY_DN1104_c0_g6_i1:282-1895(-)